MAIDFQELVQAALDRKADHAAIAQVSQIKFIPEFRKACEQDTCRKYGTNWMCPPGAGSFEELKAKALAFEHGLFFQTVHQVASSFDLKGMFAAQKVHEPIFRSILAYFQSRSDIKRLLPMNAGSCDICERCTYLDEPRKPCRFPDLVFPSVEAYGIDVINLEKAINIPYYNGKNTVSYVGMFLFAEE